MGKWSKCCNKAESRSRDRRSQSEKQMKSTAADIFIGGSLSSESLVRQSLSTRSERSNSTTITASNKTTTTAKIGGKKEKNLFLRCFWDFQRCFTSMLHWNIVAYSSRLFTEFWNAFNIFSCLDFFITHF